MTAHEGGHDEIKGDEVGIKQRGRRTKRGLQKAENRKKKKGVCMPFILLRAPAELHTWRCRGGEEMKN